ncbi:MAG: HAMP domain-containing protein, partial [Myxococcales bacterium]
MSLLVRLTLAFMALVSLVVVVGLTSFVNTRQLGTAVATLRSKSGVDLKHLDLDAVSLEIEGTWSPSGHFVASDVEVHPGQRRPKLRGKIQELDETSRTITLYGTPVHVRADTTFGGNDSSRAFERLRVGDHVEVICLVEGGDWVARDIRSEGIKQSNKVKGTPTAARLEGASPPEIEIYGLVVVIEPPGDDAPESALGRIETATQMALALNEFQASAYEVVGASRSRGPGDRPATPRAAGPGAAERLDAAVERFEHHLRRAEKADGEGMANRWLGPLARDGRALGEYARVLNERFASDRMSARAYLDEELEPFVEGELLPPVYGYLGYAQERLGGQLRWIVDRNATTTRVALATSVVAALAAAVLGFLVWRSISGPIQVLHAAAVRIGEGHLDTRVELGSKDEIGVLASAFNTMAHELGATTVSVENLEGIFDSMAGALIIFGADGAISNMNRA